jgi:hypothetical protein
MTAAWQSDWRLFANDLSEYLLTGVQPDQIAAIFAGRRVRWEGILEEKDIDELAPGVYIAVERMNVAVGNGAHVVVDVLTLPIENESILDWSHLKIGQPVKFEATIGSKLPFPPIEVKQLPSGATILMIRLSDGALLK